MASLLRQLTRTVRKPIIQARGIYLESLVYFSYNIDLVSSNGLRLMSDATPQTTQRDEKKETRRKFYFLFCLLYFWSVSI